MQMATVSACLAKALGLQGSEWGFNLASASVGDELKPVPVGLNVSWLSYTEKQFYTGNFVLPHDAMSALFEKGYPNFNYITKKVSVSTYTEIIAGLAPGGMVVIWLNGGRHRVEVACFQAHKTSVDIKEFIRRSDANVNINTYVKEFFSFEPIAKEYLDKHGIPEGLWHKYRERFALRPVVTYDAHDPITTLGMDLFFYNGERDFLETEDIAKSIYPMRARVKKLLFNWKVQWANRNQTYQLEIEFDEAEIMKAHEDVYGNDPNTHGELLIDINNGYSHYHVFLQGNNKKVELFKTKGEIMLVRQ